MNILLKEQRKALVVLEKLNEVVYDQPWEYIKQQIDLTINMTQIPYNIKNLKAKTTTINIRHPDSYLANCRELILAVNDWLHTGLVSEICVAPTDQYKKKIDRRFPAGYTTQDKTTHYRNEEYYCHSDWFRTSADELCAFCDETGESLMAPAHVWKQASRDRRSCSSRNGKGYWIPRDVFLNCGGVILPIHTRLQPVLSALQEKIK